MRPEIRLDDGDWSWGLGLGLVRRFSRFPTALLVFNRPHLHFALPHIEPSLSSSSYLLDTLFSSTHTLSHLLDLLQSRHSRLHSRRSPGLDLNNLWLVACRYRYRHSSRACLAPLCAIPVWTIGQPAGHWTATSTSEINRDRKPLLVPACLELRLLSQAKELGCLLTHLSHFSPA